MWSLINWETNHCYWYTGRLIQMTMINRWHILVHMFAREYVIRQLFKIQTLSLISWYPKSSPKLMRSTYPTLVACMSLWFGLRQCCDYCLQPCYEVICVHPCSINKSWVKYLQHEKHDCPNIQHKYLREEWGNIPGGELVFNFSESLMTYKLSFSRMTLKSSISAASLFNTFVGWLLNFSSAIS